MEKGIKHLGILAFVLVCSGELQASGGTGGAGRGKVAPSDSVANTSLTVEHGATDPFLSKDPALAGQDEISKEIPMDQFEDLCAIAAEAGAEVPACSDPLPSGTSAQ